jgi:DegV family protein with EDD domain
MSGVHVITDSTCYLPAALAHSNQITIVPVQVIVAGTPYDETEDAQAQRVSDALRDWQPVTTSRPSPERFTQAIHQAMDAGADSVVIATLSSALSATYESALLAAKEAPLPVRVVDTRTIAMALGFAVLAGAQAARDGAECDHVAEVITACAAASQVFFYVDTMEYLRRGGRISATKAAVGQALQVKPLLTVRDGAVVMQEKVRTSGKALARLTELALAAVGSQPDPDIAVQHLAAPERADALAQQLRAEVPGAHIIECPVGGVVGAHVGPGMVAVVISSSFTVIHNR